MVNNVVIIETRSHDPYGMNSVYHTTHHGMQSRVPRNGAINFTYI